MSRCLNKQTRQTLWPLSYRLVIVLLSSQFTESLPVEIGPVQHFEFLEGAHGNIIQLIVAQVQGFEILTHGT